ncbi:MAG: protein phosphatase 2C domain-containing protein [Thermomicrobiales bacterium]
MSAMGYQAWQASLPGRNQEVLLDTVESRESTTPFERAQKGSIWVIADGFGPRDDALHASRLAARIVIEHYWNSAISNPEARLRTAIERANHMLRDTREDGAPTSGATILALTLIEGIAHVAHIGRARGYLSSGGDIRQITHDHTWVAGEVAAGRLSKEEAENHPRRNVLTRALGIERQIKVDMFSHEIADEVYITLASDGAARQIDAGEIKTALDSTAESDPAERLVEFARQRGNSDSASVVVVHASGASVENESTGERLAILQSAGRSLGASLDLDVTISSVMQELLALLGGEHAAVILCDDRGRPMFDEARQFVLTRFETHPNRRTTRSSSVARSFRMSSRGTIHHRRRPERPGPERRRIDRRALAALDSLGPAAGATAENRRALSRFLDPARGVRRDVWS